MRNANTKARGNHGVSQFVQGLGGDERQRKAQQAGRSEALEHTVAELIPLAGDEKHPEQACREQQAGRRQ